MIHQCEKTNICLLCGDKGDPKCNVYCAQCKACAQHSYCLDKFYTEDNGTIIWKCEDCAPHNPKRCGSEELRKSKRLTDIAEAKYRRIKMQKESLAVRKPKSVRSSEGFPAECLRKKDIEKRQLILEDNDIFYEEPESIKCPINISTDKPSCAHPLSDPVWMGQFILNNTTDFGLVAYVSSEACAKVNLAVTELPTLLDVEMLSRCGIWPESFDMSPPNGDSIGLYFFPQYERDELIFDGVLNDIIEQESALKAVINNIELLIFSSHVLPPNERRICDKYYLWGVFKPKSVSRNIRSN